MHLAFPDTKFLCKNKILAFRRGLTHASDKGVVEIYQLIDSQYKKIFEISHHKFDIRNPYFIFDKNNLNIYVTKFDYRSPKLGFISSNLYKISDGCNLYSKPELIKEIKSVVYAPISNYEAAFGQIVKDRLWCLKIIKSRKCNFFTNDEELSIFKLKGKDYFGIIRNHPRVKLPFIYLKFNKKGELIYRKEWCKNLNESALVSPKIYRNNNKYYVAYAERWINKLGKEKGRIIIKIFNNLSDFESCKPKKSSIQERVDI